MALDTQPHTTHEAELRAELELARGADAPRDADHIRARRVGFVFQAFHLVPELTGLENVLLASRVPGAAPQAAQRGAELVEELGLEPVAGALPHQLSGGEQQRFAIARALS